MRLWEPCWARSRKHKHLCSLQRLEKCKRDRESCQARQSLLIRDHNRLMPELTRIGLLNARSVATKSAVICDRITSSCLDLCAVVETWHESVDSPQLIACTPPGYRYVEKARPRSDDTRPNTCTNYGGICLFHASFIDVREVVLPVYKTDLEVLAVYTRGARRNALIIVLYRPGSLAVSSAFFDDIAYVFERTSTFACPVIVLGDTNIHVDVTTDQDTVKFQSLISSQGLVQHVSSPTHPAGHLLDVFLTRTDCTIKTLDVEPPVLSDHSFITVTVDLQISHGSLVNTVRRRNWRHFSYADFCDDLNQSALLHNPPTVAAGLFTCYHDTSLALMEKHAPFVDTRLHAQPNAPWYDGRCRAVKINTRKLERVYRRDKSENSYQVWRQQSTFMRHYF